MYLLGDGRVDGNGDDTGKDAGIEGSGKGSWFIDTVDQGNLGREREGKE